MDDGVFFLPNSRQMICIQIACRSPLKKTHNIHMFESVKFIKMYQCLQIKNILMSIPRPYFHAIPLRLHIQGLILKL